MSPFDVTIFGLEDRNSTAERVIAEYAQNHRWLDVSVGLVGTVIPGGAIPAMIACIAVQGPLFYKPLAKELSKIYLLPEDQHTRRMVNEVLYDGITLDIMNAFNAEFLMEIARELVSEIGWGAAASFIPLVGGLVGAALDSMVAATMTWRVGTMISTYYQNGGRWLGDRSETFERSKALVGQLSPVANGRVKLDDVPTANPEVFVTQFETLKRVSIDTMLEMTMDAEIICSALRKRGVPEALIQEAHRYIKGRRAEVGLD
jgi:uncharacterized protein (DUF697 family)